MFKKLSMMLLLLSLGSAMPAMSAIVHLAGDSVDFYYDDSTLFGSANVINNSIFFLPTNFKAESLNGAGIVSTNQTLNISITAKAGNVIENILIQESGDYKLIGTDASARVNGLLAVTSNTSLNGFFPYRLEQTFDTGLLPDISDTNELWDTSAGVDLGTEPGWLYDTGITVTIENLLSASTLNLGEQAFVEKKFLGVGLIVNPQPPNVPVPAAAWLFGSGLLSLAGLVRRRSRT